MQNIKITCQGKGISEVPKGTPVLDVLKQVYPGEERAFLAAKVDGQMVDLSYLLARDAGVGPVTFNSPEGKEVLRHSTSHLMAQAVKELFPGTKLAIGPAIEDGFYYDFDRPEPFAEEDLERIEERMREIAHRNLPVSREEMARDEAIKMFEKAGETYKVELLKEIGDPLVSCYRQGEFVDLCRGPHVSSTGRIKVFKLLNLAGAYWRGDERKPMLQRIYGTAFEDKADLDAHLLKLEEMKKRDHRKLGRELDLYSIHEEAGAGLIYWHPKGARIRTIVEEFWRREHYAAGYDILYSPHIGREWLWQTSGHLDFYKENMYSPMDIDGLNYYLKPMNCPFHILIYKNALRSYRELPLRWAELGTVYRYEKSGVLHGLLRVRGFTQDDAHIFCTPEQIDDEILGVLKFSLKLLRAFGFQDIRAYLATKPKDATGEPARWEQALASLRRAIEQEGLTYEVDEGGGVFYGPKIDLKVKDALGREWQLTTIQFDFNEPERFGMVYIAEDGKEHQPYMVHRALLGSLERFFGVLIEHYAGAFPLWLAPVQAVVLPITDGQAGYAQEVLKELKGHGFRAEADFRSEKIGAKIRDAETRKVPYMLVVGKREVEAGALSVRRHGKGDLGSFPKAELYSRMRREVEEKATE